MSSVLVAPFEMPLEGRTAAETPHIIVGTNGNRGSDGALKAASLLLEHGHARVSVIGVVKLLDEWVRTDRADAGHAKAQMLEDVLVQLSRVSPSCVNWSVEIRQGDPATVLAEAARQRGARLIITGIGHHDRALDRFGAETTLSAVHRSNTPVLALPEATEKLPTSAIVATDFSAHSLSAARDSLSLFPTITSVNLVHVTTPTRQDLETVDHWKRPSGRDPGSILDDERRRIGLYAGVGFTTTQIDGYAIPEILELAQSTGADLIVAGSRGAGLAQRLIVGITAASAPQYAILALPTTTRRNWSKSVMFEGRYTPAEQTAGV